MQGRMDFHHVADFIVRLFHVKGLWAVVAPPPPKKKADLHYIFFHITHLNTQVSKCVPHIADLNTCRCGCVLCYLYCRF